MIQAPNCINPYMIPQPAPSYNAVKIDVHNPTVGTQQIPQPYTQSNPQYEPITNPYYSYPQAQLYNYPQACQPCYVPQMNIPTVNPVPAAIQQQNINVPAPVVTQPQAVQPEKPQAVQTETPKETEKKEEPANKVEVVAPQPMTPQIDLNSFIAKLTNPDYEIQANAMEEIANMVKEQPQKATELLDEKIVNALNNIINADSSKLAGPTPEQVAAREKLNKGEQISDNEKQLANTITPMEQAERNKSYAMFTAAIMQKLYGEEVAKLTGSTVPLTELPGAVTIVEQLKNNANPMVRTSAIDALSYIQQPAYKQDLTTLFTIAKNDQDKNVQDAATAALAKLEQIK